jgi:hypothetical protein
MNSFSFCLPYGRSLFLLYLMKFSFAGYYKQSWQLFSSSTWKVSLRAILFLEFLLRNMLLLLMVLLSYVAFICSFQCTLFVCLFSVSGVRCLQDDLHWSFLFGFLKASHVWINISFSSLETIFHYYILNILSIPLVFTFSPSPIPITHKFYL